ncbi:hypothetical protein Tco_1116361 [Tanacetum coccineum]
MLAYLKYQWSKDAFARLQVGSSHRDFKHIWSLTICTNRFGWCFKRVYLKLGTWKWALSPGLDDEYIQGSHYNADKFRVAAVTGYFHSIACAAHPKSVDDGVYELPASHCLLEGVKLWIRFSHQKENVTPKNLACCAMMKHAFLATAHGRKI